MMLADVGQILAPFGLAASVDPRYIFQSELNRVADEIRSTYRSLSYDHRPDSPERDRNFSYLMVEEFRRGYACFKYAVSKAVQPRTICEIGVGAGTGVRAFLTASPKAHYLGVDDGSKGRADGFDFLAFVRHDLTRRGFSFEILLADSMTLKQLPAADLFHVDGGHLFENAYNDTRLALLSGSSWILIDDTRDFAVAAGALSAVCENRACDYEWVQFEDTWTGNMLLHKR